MPPRRRKGESAPWWHARLGFVVAFVVSPSVWLAAVNGVVGALERRAQLERDVQALQGAITRIDLELREIRRK